MVVMMTMVGGSRMMMMVSMTMVMMVTMVVTMDDGDGMTNDG